VKVELPVPIRCAAWSALLSVPFTLVLGAMYGGSPGFWFVMQEIASGAAIFSSIGLVLGLIGMLPTADLVAVCLQSW
jgi:hypothetical protein